MNDDFPDFVVRSGSEHHVSVSEHTGNAKTPKNVVVSHPEETRERKLAFDHVHDVSTDTAQDKTPQQPANAVAVPASDSAKANVLNVPITVLAPNKQDVNIDSMQDHRQAIAQDDLIGTNRQTTATTAPTSANVQNVSTEVIAANKQALPTETLKDNLQSLGKGQLESDNRQAVTGAPTAGSNVQNVPVNEVISDNKQGIPQDTLDDTRVVIDTAGSESNRQAVPTDDVGINRQALSNAASAPNRQPGLTQAFSTNEQPIPTLQVEAYPTAVAQGAALSDNHQAIDAEKIADHLEKLPSAKTALAQVPFASDEASPSSAASHEAASKTNTYPTQGSSADAPSHTNLTAEEKKLKHEEAAAAFQRRLLGIKHNVDNLNDRLTDFEQKLP
ncbi:hypothetical protein B9Z39_12335 [Limnohabitans sp. JirII-29]|uniref:hypothetical protein n=1 Tax=Limnohabitans sp. JirII-29 TaxID=1835756 RepID=UPI000D349DB0|nr:hypothetical protein [Limnohabitans sp. JirII-29]PUE25390.1 hypothetical protein B9Z39_12335 [Limnohabitans sp. JirII-29]